MKRNKAPAREAKTYVEGKLRKKSAFSVFKSEFSAKEGRFIFAVEFGAEIRELTHNSISI